MRTTGNLEDMERLKPGEDTMARLISESHVSTKLTLISRVWVLADKSQEQPCSRVLGSNLGIKRLVLGLVASKPNMELCHQRTQIVSSQKID